MSLFWKLVERGPIKYIRGKRRPYLSTNDLNENGKIRLDYLNHRQRRKKKSAEEAGTPSVGIQDIWKT